MQLFYYDDKIINLEEKESYKELMNYLDQLENTDQLLATKIMYYWYLYSEGEFVNNDVSIDWEFYKKKWIEKVNLLIKNFDMYPISCLIAAYTLEMNGMDIYDSLEYEKQIKKLYEFSKNNSDDKYLYKLVDYFSNSKKEKPDSQCLNDLFRNNTLIDNYFKETLS